MRQPFGIKGVTDNPRPPVVAKAKIGQKNEAGLPTKLDHIIFVEPQTGATIPAFEALGPEPKSFLAMFPPDAETSVDAAWKRWGKTGLKCRGDGETGVDRETGEARQCAGDYNKDTPEAHLCPFARRTPRMKQGKQETDDRGNLKWNAPECKPMLSMRLVVPLAGALGLVQMDTGGVASSVPTLWWQIEQLRNYSGGELAGVAVRVGIREFQGRHGTSYAWNLATPTDEELATLREQFRSVVPVKLLTPGDAALPALPALTEAVDQDLYGISDDQVVDPSEVEIVEETPCGEEPPEADPKYADPDAFGVPGEAIAAELKYKKALKASSWGPEKQQNKLAHMEANRAKACRDGNWSSYVDWVNASTEQAQKAAK